MTINRICFADIQTSDLLYYDPSLEQEFHKFCQDRQIDCLPSLDDPKKYYRRNDEVNKKRFRKNTVSQSQRVEGSEYIFDPTLFQRFKTKPIQFVYATNELTGVVHFSDYNKPIVHEYLFSILISYERALRRLLKLHRLTNTDMSEFLKIRSKRENDRDDQQASKLKKSKPELMPFEDTYLEDLLSFANSQSSNLHLSPHQREVVDLRNMIMHAHELVKKEDASRNDHIYTEELFELFFNRVLKLLHDFKRVNNKITFLEGRTEYERL